MKILLSVLLASLSMSFNGQLEIQWSEPIQVTPDGIGGVIAPSVAGSSDGNVVVTWGQFEGSGPQAYTSYLDNGAFSTPQLVSNGEIIEPTDAFGPIVKEHNGVFFVMYEYLLTNKTFTRKSVDNGQSWESEADATEFLFGDYAYFPKFEIDGQGHPHVSMLRSNDGVIDVGACCSVNLGDSYTLFIPASDDTSNEIVAFPEISIQNDEHLVVWRVYNTSAQEYRLYGALSTNNGATFGAPAVIYQSGTQSPGGVAGIELAVLGDQYATVWHTEDNFHSLWFGYAPMTGFGEELELVDLGEDLADDVVQDFPCLAGNEDATGIVWEDNRTGAIDIYGSFGSSPENMTMMDIPFPNAEGNRKYPELDYKNGVFHLVYLDEVNERVMYMEGVVDFSNSLVETSQDDFVIYPNPASEQVQFSYSSEQVGAAFQVTDLSGRIIFQGQLNSSPLVLDVDSWASGTYHLNVLGFAHRGLPIIVR